MPIHVKIDTKDFKKMTRTLRVLKESAYPTAVRNTLNNAGFEMKKNQLHKAGSERFTTRSKNLFKSFSYVNKAYGKDINTMQAKVGMRSLGRRSMLSVIKNIDIHEKGGNITKGDMYLDSSRISKNRKRMVRTVLRFKKGMAVKNPKGTFVQKALNAHRVGLPFWYNKSGRFYLISIKSYRRTKKGIKFNSQLLMRERKNANIKRNDFISLSAKRTREKIPNILKTELKKEIRKYVSG